MAHDTAIIIMAKQPLVGQTKTRLCPPLQPAQATALYEALLRDTIVLVAGLSGALPPASLTAGSPSTLREQAADLAIAITPTSARPYFERIAPPGTRLVPVDGVDIGACLVQALEALLRAGYRKALALNADGPSLPVAYLHQAIAALDQHDLVLGPAEDGGYYLIGLKQMTEGLFERIAWSTPHVLRQTLAQAIYLQRRAWLGPLWYDIDSLPGLQRLQAELPGLPADRLPFTRRFLAGSNLPCGPT